MIRRRPGGSAGGDNYHSDDDDGSSRRRYTSASSHDHDGAVKPMVSNLFVAVFVAFFVAAGFLQNHYKVSRARDPFGVAGGASDVIPPKVESQQRKDQPSLSSVARKNRSSLLSAEEDAALERDSEGRRYHLIFSTDCSPYQHWQSYLVYYTAMKVRQTGHVTRIASGCSEEEGKAMEEWFRTDVQFMSPKRFHLQLTPHFSSVKNEKGESIGDYKFFNKPFGTRYWMENSPQLGYKGEENFDLETRSKSFDPDVLDDIVILIDPDMALMRPITADFSSDRETVISPRRRENIVTRVVGPGKPAAQVYGFGAQWMKLDLAEVTGDPDTPAAKYTNEEGRLYFPVGPPYLATVADMYKISTTWSSFVPKSHAQYPHLLAEMFAFCIAAAHLQLPHQLIDSLMISDVGATSSEGWSLIEKIPPEEVCSFAKSIDHSKYAVPNLVHLCQRYAMGDEWFFGKRAIPGDVYECATPLWAEPPDDLATKYDWKQPPRGTRKDISQDQAVRETFMICFLYTVVNEAAAFYKRNTCDPAAANLEKTRMLAREMLDPDFDKKRTTQ